MYVPTFQGLGATDFVRSADDRDTPYPFDAPHQVRFYRARNAIYHLFQTLQADGRRFTALVPDYNSGNEVLAMRAAGVAMRFYPVGADGQINVALIEALCDRHAPDVLYVIHYLGWPQPMRELAQLCRRRGMLLVEDCALALLSALDDRPLGSFGDWSIYCLYKTLPVPNGAILVQNTTPVAALESLPLHRASVASDAGRTAELMVQRIRSRVNGVGVALQALKRSMGRAAGALEVNRARVGDIGFAQSDVDLAMSPVSTHLLRRLDYDAIRRTRVRNFRYLAAQLNGHASVLRRDLADGVCPLFFPLLVPEKRTAADRLRQRGIEPLEFWNEGADESDRTASPTSRFLRRHVLGLPVHQDLTTHHLDHMVHHVADLDLRMPS
jgi:dTDP-4-amino-4,6-dideoxygalactose transaminase